MVSLGQDVRRVTAVFALAFTSFALAAGGSFSESAQARSATAKVLDKLHSAAALDDAKYRDALSTLRAGTKARGKLRGVRRSNVNFPLKLIDTLARDDRLTAERVDPLFRILKVNAAYWRSKSMPAYGARTTFGDSRIIFQYFPGQGWQFHPLANFSRLNAIWTDKSSAAKRALASYANELVEMSVSRGGFTTWEYYFTFMGGKAPWISSISQGTALQALVRAGRALADPALNEIAIDGVGAFKESAPTGLRVSSGEGSHYLIYSFKERFRVLNAFVQGLNGLFDVHRFTGDTDARVLFEAGELAARDETRDSDTGAWSLYSLKGRESTLPYHTLLRDFIDGLCARTKTKLYCNTRTSFTDYTKQDPQITSIRSAGRVGRWVAVRFKLSKMSYVQVRLTRGGKYAGGSAATVGYGSRRFTFAAPRKPGKYEIAITARDLAGNTHTEKAQVTVKRRRK